MISSCNSVYFCVAEFLGLSPSLGSILSLVAEIVVVAVVFSDILLLLLVSAKFSDEYHGFVDSPARGQDDKHFRRDF